MKKLLVLALVLSMATMANAALTMSISGPTQLATGEVGTYTVGYSGDIQILSSDTDITGTLGTIGGGLIITTNRDAVLDLIQTNPVSGNYQIAITNDILGTDMGSPLFSFTFTAGSVAGEAVLAILDNGAMNDLTWSPVTPIMEGLNVTITPEPMTLGLLAIGGLFLRRRK